MNNKISILLLIFAVLLIVLPMVNAGYSASINFYGEKTDVYLGEEILLKLSIVNLISNPKMSAQVIILPSSGMSVISSEFSKVSAGQFAANYEINPGDGRDIEIKVQSNQAGDFNIKGRVIYYFGNDTENVQDYILGLPVKVKEEPYFNPSQEVKHKEIPGFGIILAVISLIFMIKRKN